MSDHNPYLDHIAAYGSCANACEHCLALCLTREDVQRYRRCVQLCRDCADLCRLTVTLMLRNSEYVVAASQLCRVACLACAEEAALHAALHCQECARSCQVCAEDCGLHCT